jgi:uncharacterized protein
MEKDLKVDRDKLAEFCRRRNVDRLSVFGSRVRGTAGPASDVDVLVTFKPGKTPGFFTIFKMEEELSDLFGGLKVDVRTPEDLSRHFRDEVIEYAEVQYVEG